MDVRYVAGLFDGEGFVRIAKWKKPNSTHVRYCLFAGIGMTHKPVIEKLRAFGGGIHVNRHDLRNPKHRIQFQWLTSSANAAKFLQQIRPHLIVKTQEVDLALRFQRHIDAKANYLKRLPKAGSPQRDRIMPFREVLSRRLSDLKHVRFHP